MRENGILYSESLINTELLGVVYLQIHEFNGILSLLILFRAVSNCIR